MPRLSIGVPVRNGTPYLIETLECLLKQDFADVEILISDNASTDETPEVIRAAAELDPRIRYLRHDTNIGSNANFNYLLSQATGEYFAWIGADDLCDPRFYSRCVAMLDENPEAVAAFSAAERIDSEGVNLGALVERIRPEDPDPSVRYVDLVDQDKHRCLIVFAVVRRSVLADLGGLRMYPGADRTLIAQLGLLGPIVHDPEPLFFNREHERRGGRQPHSVWFADLGLKPIRSLYVHYAREVWRVPAELPVSPAVRRRARRRVAGWIARHSVGLARDAAAGVRDALIDRFRKG